VIAQGLQNLISIHTGDCLSVDARSRYSTQPVKRKPSPHTTHPASTTAWGATATGSGTR
jgi:hypothetical protein